MAYTEFDAEDIGLLVLGIFASAVLVGIASVEAFNVGMSDTFTVAGIQTSIAWVVSVATLVGIVITNDNTELFSKDGLDELRESDMAEAYVYATLGAAAVLVGWVFFPAVSSFFKSSDLWGVVYIALMTVAQVAVGWIY
ncbi:hypothetical protein [Halobaculum sp. P14]|uniref:hypothetical protein n=1 Tax=Halobaculum sp. P14 TaxID=3421638 RepID=UPI003EB746DF